MARYKIVDEDGIYFTTHTIVEWLPVFKESKYFEIIIESLKYCQANKGLHIFGYVIMLTHFHLMGQTEEGVRFQDVMRDMKKFTSKKISSKLENDGQKLFLYVFKKRRLNERRESEITRFGKMNIIHKSFILIQSVGKSWSICTTILW